MSQIEHSSLIELTEEVFSITLKEILDVINKERAEQGESNLQHSKAMKKVESLMKQPNFGTVSKIATVYNDRGQEIETYLFNKKQAIAVGARLDEKRLMLLMTKVEQLENEKALMLKDLEKFLPKGGYLEENKRGILKTLLVRSHYKADPNSPEAKLLQEKYELQKRLNGLMQEEIKKEIEIRDFQLSQLINYRGEIK